ncbi:MAG: aspartyl protease family protein [candidate division Zixibacteria bacterium]|nr:aspartyl protease family protein [candidate division Zixibacteria bacterium]
MRHFCLMLICLFTVVLYSPGATAQEQLSDPYEIMEKHMDAMGGLERLKAETTSYTEGKLYLAGLEGSFKQWKRSPLTNRTEVDLGVFKQITGDNGEFSWVEDANGKVKILKDENSVKRREISRLNDLYDYMNKDSKNFSLTFDGIEKVGENDCYIVTISNTINDDITKYFVNVGNYLLEKTVNKSPDAETHALYSDYREINGIKIAFRQESVTYPIEQKQTVELIKYESNPNIDPTLFEPPGGDVKDFEFTDGESAENIPFEFIENHLYIKVIINGRERLWCLDTGAGMSVIDSAYARELGLKVEGNLKGQGAGQTVDVAFTTLPPFSIEGIRFQEQNIIVIDIGSLFKKWDYDVYGILGYDFLSRFVIKVDYADEKLSFYDPDKFEYRGDGVILDAPLVGHTFSLPVTVDGIYSGQWSVDLGAGSTSFHYPFAEENGFLKRDGIHKLGMGAGGHFDEKMLKFKTIELAGFTVKEPYIDFPLQKSGAFGSSELIGNLGNSFFRHFVLYLDYKSQRMIVEKGKDYDRVFPVDRSGLQLIRSDDDEIEVFNASENTPSAKAGFQKGDIIMTINDIKAEYFGGAIAIRKLFQEKAGTRYSFKVKRGDQIKELSMTLKDLI